MYQMLMVRHDTPKTLSRDTSIAKRLHSVFALRADLPRQKSLLSQQVTEYPCLFRSGIHHLISYQSVQLMIWKYM